MSNSAGTSSGRRLRPTLSMIISLFALVIAMSTTAYATTIAAKNSVISKSIKNGEVKTKDLARAAVTPDKLRDFSVSEDKLTDNAVSSAAIQDGQVDTNDLSAAVKAELTGGAAAYSTHFEEGRPVPTTMTTMATLNLPPGSYVLTSKAQVDTHTNSHVMECDLVAGAAIDRIFIQGSDVHESHTIFNSLVATLVTGGTAALQCQSFFTANGIGQVRLTAVSVDSITNQP